MMDIINKFMAELSGFDYWFALILLVIGLTGWFYLGKKSAEKETAKRQIKFVVLVAVALPLELAFIIYSLLRIIHFPRMLPESWSCRSKETIRRILYSVIW